MATIDGKQLKPGSVPASALAAAPQTTVVLGGVDEFGCLLAADGITVLSPDDIALQIKGAL